MSRDEFDYAYDRYDEAECAAFERAMRRRQLTVVPELTAAVPAAAAARPPRRCASCGYRRCAPGHRVACLAGAA